MVLLLLVLVILTSLGLLGIYQFNSIKRIYRNEVKNEFQNQPLIAAEILTEHDLKTLPIQIQKYLRYVGVVGEPKVQNFYAQIDGKMKLSKEAQNWASVKFEQHSFVKKPARFFFITGKMFGIKVFGRDKYNQGKGNMLIKALGVLPIANAKDPRMDEAALVTHFNDMCLLAPSTLIDKRITWEVIDENGVKATFKDQGIKVSVILQFNTTGELINFITNNRYYSPSGKTYQNIPWSTPVTGYDESNGIKKPSSGRAIWHFPEGDFVYGEVKIKKIQYNLNNSLF